jgi:pyrimidine operon attenuation protein/uracil phosphoribosyltransferase
MKERELDLALRRMASEIIEKCAGDPHLAIIGVRTRGEPLAQRLAAMLAEMERISPPVGTLDIGVHRDDVNHLDDQKILGPTEISFDLAERQIILVDDVFYTGRTVRAALDALTELGRPRRVWLAVLIDRGHREFPLRPDFVGKSVPTAPVERVNVRLREVDGEDGVWLVKPD